MTRAPRALARMQTTSLCSSRPLYFHSTSAVAWLSDALQDPPSPRRGWWKTTGFKSLIALPIFHGDTLIAVLALVGKARFPVRHREMLELFAAQAAVAIVNARLYADSNARREAAEALAEVGRLLSQSLDPVIVARRHTGL